MTVALLLAWLAHQPAEFFWLGLALSAAALMWFLAATGSRNEPVPLIPERQSLKTVLRGLTSGAALKGFARLAGLLGVVAVYLIAFRFLAKALLAEQ